MAAQAKIKEQQVKSKQRVADVGEVFTAEREVKAMCDLVKDETERIESHFLEPACGNGNFLAEVLNRKLAVVERRYKKSPLEFEKYSLVALSSLYGIDIMEDNAQECRERLFNIWNDSYSKRLKNNSRNECREAAKFLLRKNIINGDALSLKDLDGQPIIFSEWKLIGEKFKRTDSPFQEAVNQQDKKYNEQLSLFAFEDEAPETSSYYALLDQRIKEFPLIDFWRIQEYE